MQLGGRGKARIAVRRNTDRMNRLTGNGSAADVIGMFAPLLHDDFEPGLEELLLVGGAQVGHPPQGFNLLLRGVGEAG